MNTNRAGTADTWEDDELDDALQSLIGEPTMFRLPPDILGLQPGRALPAAPLSMDRARPLLRHAISPRDEAQSHPRPPRRSQLATLSGVGVEFGLGLVVGGLVGLLMVFAS